MATFLATVGQIYVRLLEMHHVDAAALLREAGIDATVLRDPAARVASEASDVLCRKAAALIADPAFALRAARCWHPSDLGALGYAWLASSTLRTGLQRLERYNRLLGEKAQLKLTNSRTGLRVDYDTRRRDPLVRGILTDFALSLIVDMCRMNYGAALRPVEVRLTRRKPASLEAWRSYYGCGVKFDSDGDSVLFAPAVVDDPLPTANRQLAGTLDGILAAQLAALDKDNIPARCKSELIEQLSSGEISVDGMARQLHMSRRTLQRKLSEAETSYEKLVDDTRRDLAQRYMDEGVKSVSEVTFLLGFSGQSAFTRAFKRWTGASPTAYRNKNSYPA